MISSDNESPTSEFEQVSQLLQQRQNHLLTMFESYETSARFLHDSWGYQGSGGGLTCIMNGNVFERVGVNFSSIQGKSLPATATERHPELCNKPFQATGVSVVSHPCNPMVPTGHANVRFMTVEGPQGPVWWFGGGFDLTPYYGFESDCHLWHESAYTMCLPYGDSVYSEYKRACDDYFYLPHRQESRGIGGLFFDDLNHWSFDRCLQFILDVIDCFQNTYAQLVNTRKDMPYTQEQRQFQCYRRGRYVEFNLLYDRGTLFGLQSKGRTESILMSMPPVANWQYQYCPQPGSDEAKLAEYYLVAKDWVNHE